MTVKIDMEMPKSCLECKFCGWIENNDCYICQCQLTQAILGDVVLNKYAHRRYKNCPLQEVKE